MAFSKPRKNNEKDIEWIQKHYAMSLNDFNSSYEQLLSRPNRNTLYVQRLRSILSIVYKSVMKQRRYMSMTCLSLMKTVKVESMSHLFTCSPRQEDTVLMASATKQVIFGISRIRV